MEKFGKSLIHASPNETFGPPLPLEKRPRDSQEPNLLSPDRNSKISNICQLSSNSSSPNGTIIIPPDGAKVIHGILEASLSWTPLLRDKCSDEDVTLGVKHIGTSYCVDIDKTLFNPVVINSQYSFAMLNAISRIV